MSIEKINFNQVRQENRSFTTFYNEVIQNINDAFCLGVYCYLSSLPQDWDVNKKHLMNHFGVGRDKLIQVMKWLNENHLLEYKQDRNPDGTLGKSLIIIKDGRDFIELTGQRNHRTTENPLSGKTEPTYINNIIYKRKDIKKDNKINSAQPKKPVAAVVQEKVVLPDWLKESLWTEFLQHRKSLKSPMTQLAQRKAINSLDKMRADGQDIESVINASIVNGWKGLFEIKSQGANGNAKYIGSSGDIRNEAPNRSWASRQWDILREMGGFERFESDKPAKSPLSIEDRSSIPEPRRVARSFFDLD